jgi:hypothetical protein
MTIDFDLRNFREHCQLRKKIGGRKFQCQELRLRHLMQIGGGGFFGMMLTAGSGGCTTLSVTMMFPLDTQL